MEIIKKYLKENIYFKHMSNIAIIIYSNPFLLSLASLLLVLFLSLFVFHPYYQTADDFNMRSIVDGSYSFDKLPQEFIIWSSIYYGRFLKTLYTLSQDIHWYDICSYIFLSCSMFTTMLCLYKKDKSNIFYNFVLFLTSIFVFLPVFVFLQFTIVSGTLLVAATILSIYLLNKQTSYGRRFVCSCSIIVFIVISSMIRFEAFLSMLPLSSICTLLFVNKRNFIKFLKVFFIVCIGVVFAYLIHQCGNNLVQATPSYKEILDYNEARFKLTEGSIIFSKKDSPACSLKYLDSLSINNNYVTKPFLWNKGIYSVFLQWLDIGDKEIYNLQNINKVYSDDILIKKNVHLKFDLADYYRTFKYYLALSLMLVFLFPYKSVIKKSIMSAILFFIYIMIMSSFYKSFPPRVWINFVNLFILGCVSFVTFNDNSINFWNYMNYRLKTFRVIFIYICIFLFCMYGVKIVRRYIAVTKIFWEQYKKAEVVIANLDKDKVYLIDIHLIELYSKPFIKDNIFNKGYKFIPISSFLCRRSKFLENYGIPLIDTIDYICSDNNIFYLTFIEGTYYNYYLRDNKIAISRFMRDNYGKQVAFIPLKEYEYTNEKVYFIVKLTPEQIRLGEELRKSEYYKEALYLKR